MNKPRIGGAEGTASVRVDGPTSTAVGGRWWARLLVHLPVGEDGLFCKHLRGRRTLFRRPQRSLSGLEPTSHGPRAVDKGCISIPAAKMPSWISSPSKLQTTSFYGRLSLEATKKSGSPVDLDEFRAAIEKRHYC